MSNPKVVAVAVVVVLLLIMTIVLIATSLKKLSSDQGMSYLFYSFILISAG